MCSRCTSVILFDSGVRRWLVFAKISLILIVWRRYALYLLFQLAPSKRFREREENAWERSIKSKRCLLFNKKRNRRCKEREKMCVRLHKERERKRTNRVSFKIIMHEQNMCFRLCTKKARPFNVLAQVGFRVCSGNSLNAVCGSS